MKNMIYERRYEFQSCLVERKEMVSQARICKIIKMCSVYTVFLRRLERYGRRWFARAKWVEKEE